MAALAIDIETASPFNSPDNREEFKNTDYFELVAVAVGYQSSPGDEVETEVFLRNGDWEIDHTANLLDRVLDWCEQRPVEHVLTYNGEDFDEIHLREWATEVDNQGLTVDASRRLDQLLSKHIDVALLAEDQLDGYGFPKFEEACERVGIETIPTRYSDYGLDDGIIEQSQISDEQVEGRHIGEVWGEKYVGWLEAGLEDRKSFKELERLLVDYATEDVRPLIELHQCLSADSVEI